MKWASQPHLNLCTSINGPPKIIGTLQSALCSDLAHHSETRAGRTAAPAGRGRRPPPRLILAARSRRDSNTSSASLSALHHRRFLPVRRPATRPSLECRPSNEPARAAEHRPHRGWRRGAAGPPSAGSPARAPSAAPSHATRWGPLQHRSHVTAAPQSRALHGWNAFSALCVAVAGTAADARRRLHQCHFWQLRRCRCRCRCSLLRAGNPAPKELHVVLPPSATMWRRIIVVGDIHGCPGERPLLARCAADNTAVRLSLFRR